MAELPGLRAHVFSLLLLHFDSSNDMALSLKSVVWLACEYLTGFVRTHCVGRLRRGIDFPGEPKRVNTGKRRIGLLDDENLAVRLYLTVRADENFSILVCGGGIWSVLNLQ